MPHMTWVKAEQQGTKLQTLGPSPFATAHVVSGIVVEKEKTLAVVQRRMYKMVLGMKGSVRPRRLRLAVKNRRLGMCFM
uniref:Macaca fascicularis brain cDNA clone: QtrA-15754, similar to human tuberous sclerosis 1 (TSC1), mRNA, RefSeq: NM_000368.2 n=1 Tax=Macaca fascicularis TaxID=9541 RepID=I7G975_MACFA|nr:unnamed protein product [Macaca fascicularis]